MIKVKTTRAGDGWHRKGQVVSLTQFLGSVKWVLENSGEMPIAITISV